jgi:hypothetical protein
MTTIEIKVLSREESDALGWDANWIGTLGTNGPDRHFVKTKAQAIAWVNRVAKNWPAGQWAIYENFHYKTGESIGWGATAL